MRNKEEFSWIICLLLTEYALSENTCERSTGLGQLSFGEILPRSAFTTRYQVSLYQCATECRLRRQRCKSFNYRRSFLSCQLCEQDSGPGGINLQPEAGVVHSNIDTWKIIRIGNCNAINCSWTQRCDSSKPDDQSACIPTECPFAVLKPGATIEPSNETAVSTKARYRCVSHNMERGDPITTCLESRAEWSTTDFKCICNTPPAIRWAINETSEVEVGQNYTYRCQGGLFEKGVQNPTVTCQQDGSWTSTNFICVKQNWTQDTIYPNNIHKSDVIRTMTGIDFLTCMQQCDDKLSNCLSFFYENHTSHCVLSASFRRGLPQNFNFSDGIVYYTAPSASCDMEYSNVSLGGSYFCIKFHDILKTFNEAMKLCESEKAKLLVITTKAQLADAKKFIHGVFGLGTYLGMWKETNNNRWMSWDGEVVVPEWNLNPIEPTNLSEDCTHIYFYYDGVCAWYCTNNLRVLCHKKRL